VKSVKKFFHEQNSGDSFQGIFVSLLEYSHHKDLIFQCFSHKYLQYLLAYSHLRI